MASQISTGSSSLTLGFPKVIVFVIEEIYIEAIRD
jgi:hypothetical protein